jgi:hypothetical protein
LSFYGIQKVLIEIMDRNLSVGVEGGKREMERERELKQQFQKLQTCF